ncbi:hypothetical protein AUR04nite_21220 [Glutamicibacter uratoxydans]|uniref:Gram-positive cocci surface proteins LPxTG domain-containing protein n=1 Tax=Glutamicibacter uratoxydans TaxID=43667 RepID=A0A4Y4DSW3_GLUUR|nr:hypothetical protein [Glutamicibacter uratoxydans]GED06590.1 hypothetical protein AUR04nite_21220 [Glutamicibacter uratoxydans]
MAIAPAADATPPVPVSIAAATQEVPPIHDSGKVVPVPMGQELIQVDKDLTSPDGYNNGYFTVFFKAQKGLVKEGEVLHADTSWFPNSGESWSATVKNGIITDDRYDPNNPPSEFPDSDAFRYVQSYAAFGHPENLDDPVFSPSDNIGGAVFVPVSAPSLETSTVDKVSGFPLLPVGSKQWTLNIPEGMFDLTGARMRLTYWGMPKDGPTNGDIVEFDLTDTQISNGKLVISDDEISKLTEGFSYYISIRSADDTKRAGVWLGLYGSQPEPTQSPTAEPTQEPTEEPTETPTEEPTQSPTETPTEEPTQSPTAEPTQEPTEEPTETPTEEPTQSPTDEPTQEPTEEPTETPTEEPTQQPTEEPTETPTEEPTQQPTEEPTQPTSKPSGEPDTQKPESGTPVDPKNQKLALNEAESDPSKGHFVFTVKAAVENGPVSVSYRSAPNAVPHSVRGSIAGNTLTFDADENLMKEIKEHQELLITIRDAQDQTISTVLKGKSSMGLISDLVDDRLGVPLAEHGTAEWTFKIPSDFPEISKSNFTFDVQHVDTDGVPSTIKNVSFEISENMLTINDARVPKADDGLYMVSGSPNAGAHALAKSAVQEQSVSSWFGVYSPTATLSPTESSEPSRSSSESPSDSQTPQSTSPTATTLTPTESKSEKPEENRDQLAQTGVSSGLYLIGAISLTMLIAGSIVLRIRRGKHS